MWTGLQLLILYDKLCLYFHSNLNKITRMQIASVHHCTPRPFSSFHSGLHPVPYSYQYSPTSPGMLSEAERRSLCIQYFLDQGPRYFPKKVDG